MGVWGWTLPTQPPRRSPSAWTAAPSRRRSASALRRSWRSTARAREATPGHFRSSGCPGVSSPSFRCPRHAAPRPSAQRPDGPTTRPNRAPVTRGAQARLAAGARRQPHARRSRRRRVLGAALRRAGRWRPRRRRCGRAGAAAGQALASGRRCESLYRRGISRGAGRAGR